LETYGADHACLSEISFIDQAREEMQARFVTASSCYGCPVKCEQCKTHWGNPSTYFDMVHADDTDGAWSCTNIGSFVGGIGLSRPEVIFTLKRRPGKVVFRSPEGGNSTWTPKSWIMQEQESDGTWQTIAEQTGALNAIAQPFYVKLVGTEENPAQWPIDYEFCGGMAKGGKTVFPIEPSADPPAIAYNFTPTPNLMIANLKQGKYQLTHPLAEDY
jgi:hypothetical protein